MKILSLIQGSAEWLAARLQHFTASEAAAMLGLSKYQTRDALLRMKKTGISPDIDSGTQRLFDRGHEVEAMARPIAEGIIGRILFPITGSAVIDGLPLLASFDGAPFDEETFMVIENEPVFEHKLLAQWLVDYLKTHNDLPDTHWPQAEQLLMVSGAPWVLFMTSNGIEEGSAWIKYESKPERRQRVIDGWKQFAVDLDAYEVQDVKPEPAKAAVESLPAVFVQVQGSLTCQNNIGVFAEEMADFIKRVPAKPETDDDFALCEAAVKTLINAEDALKAAKDSSLGYVQSLADLHRLIDSQAEIARSNRLRLDRLVKAEKENRKTAITSKAVEDYRVWRYKLANSEYLPATLPDFAGAIKGLKTITSTQSAVNDELARVKIEATREHDKITANLETINAAAEYAFLFNDKRDLVSKDAELVRLIVQTRIDQHKTAESQRIEAAAEAQRARIRAEEQAKAEREAAERLQAAQVVEPAKVEPVAVEPVVATVATPESASIALRSIETIESCMANNSNETMTLGQINAKLAPIQLSADGLRTLGFEFVGTAKAAKLYRVSDFTQICASLINHISNAAKADAA